MNEEYFEEDDDERDDREPIKKSWRGLYVILLLVFIALSIALIYYSSAIASYLNKIFPGTKFNASQTESLFNPPKLKGEESGQVNILLLGMRGEDQNYPYLTNAVMVLNYNVVSKKINSVSLPRDLWVQTDKYGSKKISYICQTPDFKTNPQTCFDTGKFVIKNTLGIDIDYSFLIDFKGFVNLIDQAGPVDVNVAGHKDEWTFLRSADFAGAQDVKDADLYHLNGKQALIFVRWPENALPDFNRFERQQILMKSAETKLFSSGNLFNFIKLSKNLKSASGSVNTDMKLWEAKRITDLLAAVSPGNISKYSLTSEANTNGGLLSVTHFQESETLSPAKGTTDFSQIKDWAAGITK